MIPEAAFILSIILLLAGVFAVSELKRRFARVDAEINKLGKRCDLMRQERNSVERALDRHLLQISNLKKRVEKLERHTARRRKITLEQGDKS